MQTLLDFYYARTKTGNAGKVMVLGGRARLDDSLQAPCVTPLEVDYCTLGVL
jgi:hypothetical protein